MGDGDDKLAVLAAPQRPLWRLRDGSLQAAAPAKLNLDLYVGPRRDDGYHELDSLAVKVTLLDVLTFGARNDAKIDLRCEGAPCGPPQDNLVFRAARLLAATHGRPVGGGDIHVVKHIPPGAGLGGGSSDAAMTLVAASKLWHIDLPPEQFAILAAQLGSDVPLFLGPRMVRMTGRGEKLHAAAVHAFLAVLHIPPLACPTKDVYAAFDAAATAQTPRQLDPAELAAAPPSRWRDRLVNQLAAPAMGLWPPLRELHGRLSAAARRTVCLTGSGSAMFVLCDDRAEADEVLGAFESLGLPGRNVAVAPNPW